MYETYLLKTHVLPNLFFEGLLIWTFGRSESRTEKLIKGEVNEFDFGKHRKERMSLTNNSSNKNKNFSQFNMNSISKCLAILIPRKSPEFDVLTWKKKPNQPSIVFQHDQNLVGQTTVAFRFIPKNIRNTEYRKHWFGLIAEKPSANSRIPDTAPRAIFNAAGEISILSAIITFASSRVMHVSRGSVRMSLSRIHDRPFYHRGLVIVTEPEGSPLAVIIP